MEDGPEREAGRGGWEEGGRLGEGKVARAMEVLRWVPVGLGMGEHFTQELGM